jgi:hypothetical protein
LPASDDVGPTQPSLALDGGVASEEDMVERRMKTRKMRVVCMQSARARVERKM